MSNFYVYEWFNVDTDEVFYVGKGKEYRYKDIENRNQYFKNYYNKYNCDVRKIKENLEEQDAFDLEIKLIKKYREIGQCKCNLANGGEGSTFPENSREDICSKLRALYNLRNAMDDMPNEIDYDPTTYDEKSTEELKYLYEYYYAFQENEKANREIEKEYKIFNPSYINEKELDESEINARNQEILMLTDLLSKKLIEQSDDLSEFKDIEDEMDYMFSDVDADILIDKMLKDENYKKCIISVINSNLWALKNLGKLNQTLLQLDFSPILHLNIKSFSIKDRFINIKLKTNRGQGTLRVNLDIYDILFGLLYFKDKTLIEIIYNEIQFAPIIQG